MTFEEAKKILEKEGFSVEKATRASVISESFIEYEDPTICEAMQVVSSAGYFVCMEMSCFDERKARLKKEHEKHANAPVSGKEKAKKGNPALEEAASQFNDALLDEQAKKIKELTEENEDWKSWHEMQNRQIALSNIAFRNEKNRLGKEIARLNKIIHKKNEELRLSTIREKNLAELGLKYVGENEKLKKKLADKIVDEIDARALKSAESALAYKEKVIAEKDEVIADLGKELKAKKALVDHISKIRDSAKINLNLREKECENLKEALEEKTKLVEMVRNASKEYCNYGVAANEFIKELASLYVLANNKGIINDEMLERCKNYQTYGFPANCNRETKKEINDIARGNWRPSATIVQCDNGMILSKEEAEIIERCTKNGTELHYSEKDGLTYTNVFGEEMPIRCLRGMFHVFTDEEIENMKK